jgi:enamine deaminase RidA (YjgF/YER057c/UK114 family)
MAKREIVETAAPWEPVVGYSRAVKVGPFIAVTGTTSLNDRGEFVGDGDLIVQTRQCLRNITNALSKLNSSIEDVVRTRIYMRNISDWELVGKIHGQHFNKIRPATTMVEVNAFIDPRILVEIEADAIVAADLPDQWSSRSAIVAAPAAAAEGQPTPPEGKTGSVPAPSSSPPDK